MSFSVQEGAILNRYHEKTRVVGGAAAGYLLRVEALGGDPASVEAALESLAGKGLLQRTEAGDRYLLTEEGAEVVGKRAFG